MKEDNLPKIVRDLVRTLADMIDHDVEYFFGYIVFLELAFPPKNSSCTQVTNDRGFRHLKAV